MVVVCVVFVLGIGLFALLAFVIDRGVHHLASNLDAMNKVEQQTGIATYPFGFDATHPPQKDVYGRPLHCSVDRSTGLATAQGSVFNHSGHPSSYFIVVSFTQGGTEVGSGAADVFNVPSGQSVNFQASGSAGSAKSPTCKVTLILRSDNPKLAPSTTTTTG